MNDIAPALPDDWFARNLPNDDPELAAAWEAAKLRKARDDRRKGRDTSYWRTFALICAVAALGSSAANLWSAANNTGPAIIPVVLEAGGVVETKFTVDEIPTSMQQDLVQAMLKKYVSMREGYTYDSALENYNAVSAMSDDAVKHSYQTWFLNSQDSPNKKINNRGKIIIADEKIDPVPERPHVAWVYYWRIEEMIGDDEIGPSDCLTRKDPRCSHWRATIAYQFGKRHLLQWQRDKDPAGMRVTSYNLREDSAS